MNSATRWYCDVGGVESVGETNKITSKREISSSHFLINFLCVREMRAIVKQEAVDHVKKEAEIEWFWSKCMKLLLQTFEKHPMDNSSVAGELEDILQKEFDLPIIVNIHTKNTYRTRQEEKVDTGRNTIVAVQFEDCAGTVVVYRVIRKQSILSLRSIAASKVSRSILKVEDIQNIVETLGVPRDVVADVRKVFSDDLKVATYSKYLYEKTCCVGCASLYLANHW